MATKEITPNEYAKMKGVTKQAVSKMIREGSVLQDVIEIKSFGRFYVLVVPIGLSKKSFKKKSK